MPATLTTHDNQSFSSSVKRQVSVYRPDGTLLVKDLNFTVERGQRVLVTGGNGCGKWLA